MRFGSVCSGIEAASVAWNPLGWEAAWLAEIEPFPSAVLAHHYPEVPNYGDMTKLPGKILSGDIEAPDLFCGGTPCQAFSVAGLRKSLDDTRGNLSLVFCEIANAIDSMRSIRGERPSIVFWENVPGVLSTKDNAFGCFLAGLAGEDDPLQPPGGKWQNAGCVFGPQRAVAWRILDAQYFGVAQRRRRVFVVASARTDIDPAAILLEFDGVRRDTAPSRETRKATPASTGAGAAVGCEFGPSGGRFVDVNPTLDARAKDGPVRNQLAGAVAQPFAVAYTIDEEKNANVDMYGTLQARRESGGFQGVVAAPVAFSRNDDGRDVTVDLAPTMRVAGRAGGMLAASIPPMQVRRLTPTECERLQGFKDGYTAIPWRNKPADQCPDGPRYKALGNSWAVPVARWIGERIARACHA